MKEDLNPNPLKNLDGSGVRAERGLEEMRKKILARIAGLRLKEETKEGLTPIEQQELVDLIRSTTT